MNRPRASPPAATTECICLDVVELHAGDAAFLWELRRRAVSSHKYTLLDLATTDDRVEANLDGLLVARRQGWKILLDEMEAGSAGAIFAGCVWALRADDAVRFEAAMAYAADDPDCQRAVVSALGWAHADGERRGARSIGEGRVRELLADTNAVRRSVAVHAQAVCRLRWSDAELETLLRAPEVAVRARAARYAGEVGAANAVGALARLLDDESTDVWQAAAWALCVLAPAQSRAVERLMLAALECATDGESVAMVARSLPPARARQWVRELASSGRARTALQAAAAAGWPELLDDVVALMGSESESTAQLAGQAFSHITGADRVQLELEREGALPGEEGAVEDESEDDGAIPVANDEEDLPIPDPEKVAGWWREHASELAGDTRHLAGKPRDHVGLRHVLAHGKQPQRRDAAIELARMRRGIILNTRQPGYAQARALLGWS